MRYDTIALNLHELENLSFHTGEALALVVFQRCSLGRFAHVCEGATIRDGHSASDRVQGGGKGSNGTPPKGWGGSVFALHYFLAGLTRVAQRIEL